MECFGFLHLLELVSPLGIDMAQNTPVPRILYILSDLLQFLITDSFLKNICEALLELDLASSTLELDACKRDRSSFHGSVEPVLEELAFEVVLTENDDLVLVQRLVPPELCILSPSLETCKSDVDLLWNKKVVLELFHELWSEGIFLPFLEGTVFIFNAEDL